MALSLSLAHVFSSCSDDDADKVELTSYLNGTYSGTQLEVTIDGQKNTSVTSAEVRVGTNSQGTHSPVDVTLNDFPTVGNNHNLKTTLENERIEGTTSFDGKTYTFSVKIEGSYGSDTGKSCNIVFCSTK